MAEGDHVANPSAAPYPTSRTGTVTVMLGGFIENAATAATLGVWVAPYDCWVEEVYYSYFGFTADLDAVTLVTVDAAKTIVTAADMGADLVGVKQTLNADVANRAYQINKGDIIKLSADSTDANERGVINVQIEVRPVYG